jgi:RNA polymerase sigma factor (sigma-70 family)
MRIQLRTLYALFQKDPPATDEELLDRFVELQDEEAFNVLVRRHGPLVWRACCRVLGESPDAEDAFQVTFLTLARWARKLRRGELAGWLFQVARRAALDLREAAGRRRGLEQKASARPGLNRTEEIERAETYRLLDEELAGLPEKLRVPLVLRYLEGKTLEDVARILGCSRRAVSKRLARAEGILRTRLSDRGVAVAIGAVLGLLGTSASAAPVVSSRLVTETTRAAMAFRAGTLHTAAAQTALRLLSVQVSWTIRSWLTVVLGGAVLLGGVVGFAVQASGPAKPASVPAADNNPAPRLDAHGDPLPRGAIARLGTLRWQQEGLHGDLTQPIHPMPDGKQFLTVDRCEKAGDAPLHLWDLASGKIVHSLGGELGAKGVHVSVRALSRDGRMAVLGVSRTIRLWDLKADRELQRWDGADGPWVAAFSPDGRSVVLACRFSRENPVWLRRYAVDTGKELESYRGEVDGVQQVAFSPDGRTLVAAGGRFAHRWEVSSGREISHFEFDPNPIGPRAVVLSADGKTLGFSNARRPGEIAIWNTREGKEERRWRTDRHTSISWFALSPDGRFLASVSRGDSWNFALWETATGKELAGMNHAAYQHVAFSPDGRTLICPHESVPAITLRDVPSGRERETPGHHDAVRGVIPAGQDTVLTWTPHPSDVVLWERTTGKELRRLPVKDDTRVLGAGASPDGSLLAVAETADNTSIRLRVWEQSSGREIWSAVCPGTVVTYLNFASDGKRIIADSGAGLRIWEARTGKQLVELRPGPKHSTGYTGVHLSPDGHRLLTWHDCLAGIPGHRIALYFWDVNEGKIVRKLQFSGVGGGAVVSPDGTVLACVASLWDVNDEKVRDGIQLYDLAKGEKVATIPAVVRAPMVVNGGQLCFSPDGTLLSSSRPDGQIDIWRVKTGKRLATLSGHWGGISRLAFTSDGRTFLSGSGDMTGLVWDIADLTSVAHRSSSR